MIGQQQQPQTPLLTSQILVLKGLHRRTKYKKLVRLYNHYIHNSRPKGRSSAMHHHHLSSHPSSFPPSTQKNPHPQTSQTHYFTISYKLASFSFSFSTDPSLLTTTPSASIGGPVNSFRPRTKYQIPLIAVNPANTTLA